MDLQKLVDAMSSTAQRERKNYHLLLGELIIALKDADASASVVFPDGTSPCEPHSYRGYYSDLAFEASDKPRTVAEVLSDATEALNETFEGYKGGDYRMDEETPLWRSTWGDSSGIAIMDAMAVDGKIVLLTKETHD